MRSAPPGLSRRRSSTGRARPDLEVRSEAGQTRGEYTRLSRSEQLLQEGIGEQTRRVVARERSDLPRPRVTCCPAIGEEAANLAELGVVPGSRLGVRPPLRPFRTDPESRPEV